MRLPSRLTLLVVVLGLVDSATRPRQASAQSWVVEAERVTIDDKASGRIGGSADRIPQGFGVALRYAVEGIVFFEANASRGQETRMGAVCGGFILHPEVQCIPEIVKYEGGLVAIFVGWPGQISVGSGISLGLRPRVGLASLYTEEVGSDTNRSYEERTRALVVGIAAQVSYDLGGSAFGVVASAGLDRIDPFDGEVCLDCRREFTDILRQATWGIGVVWRP
jgi:hypothetical protein